MADSSFSVDPGTTTAFDTRTEATNGNHRSVVVIGDPSVNAGVAPVDVTKGLTVTALGKDAQNASITGDPVLCGGEGRKSLGTPVTEGNAVRQLLDLYGMSIVTFLGTSHVTSNGTPITTTTTGVISAPSAGTHIRMYRIHFSNGGATSTWIAIRDGASGNQYYRSYLPQGGLISLSLNTSSPLDLSSATRADIVLSAAGNIEYQIDYLVVTD